MGALVVALLLSATLPAGAQTRGPLGAQVRVTRSGSSAGLTGELISVSPDSLWLLRHATLLAVPAREVMRIEVKRRPMGAGGIMAWGVIVGTITGVALTGACASLEGASCGGVLPGVLLTWTLWSGIWAAVAGSPYKGYPPAKLQTEIPAFARFPQGLPAGYRASPSPVPPDSSSGGRRR